MGESSGEAGDAQKSSAGHVGCVSVFGVGLVDVFRDVGGKFDEVVGVKMD